MLDARCLMLDPTRAVFIGSSIKHRASSIEHPVSPRTLVPSQGRGERGRRAGCPEAAVGPAAAVGLHPPGAAARGYAAPAARASLAEPSRSGPVAPWAPVRWRRAVRLGSLS